MTTIVNQVYRKVRISLFYPLKNINNINVKIPCETLHQAVTKRNHDTTF